MPEAFSFTYHTVYFSLESAVFGGVWQEGMAQVAGTHPSTELNCQQEFEHTRQRENEAISTRQSRSVAHTTHTQLYNIASEKQALKPSSECEGFVCVFFLFCSFVCLLAEGKAHNGMKAAFVANR